MATLRIDAGKTDKLRPGDIRSYGVSSVSELLTELAPQLNSARAVSTSSYIKHLAGNIRIATQRQAFLAETGRVLDQRS